MVIFEKKVKKIYCFDIDGTICKTNKTNYIEAEPILTRINKINSLFNEGHIIKIFTARGSETGVDWKLITKKQLSEWGVQYSELIFGKPAADVYIDDKAINDNDFIWY